MSVQKLSIVAFYTLFASVLCCVEAASEDGVNEAGSGSANDLSPKAVEMATLYQKSIKYWDTDNVEIRQSILKELSVTEDVKTPGCPRIRYPIICDNDKMLLENSCYFRMRRQERPGLLPVMVFATSPIEVAREKCQKGF